MDKKSVRAVAVTIFSGVLIFGEHVCRRSRKRGDR
mgnify:CR=1 FL=1